MGQRQSTADGGTDTPSDGAALRRDYYEVLEVERTATEDELKKAYRRKALELHPDRNYGNVEEATRLFAEVQTAYEVLSDAQERAWYDSHRDVLLRGDTVGGDGGEQYSYNMKMTTTEEVLKLMLKFNGRLDYSDAPSGFYGGLNEFFQTLAKEEDIACQWEDVENLDYPAFGAKDDDYEEVVRPFYAAWTSFATKKSYAWKDQYRLSDAPERRIRRLMEKENRKLRDEAIQEYNDAVRSLVAFVRKRDPRVQNNQKSEAERQKALRDAATAQAARARAQQQARNEELENYVLPEWAQSRTTDEHEGGFSSESDVEEHEYDCVVCDKTFKSEAQFKAHEKSKKHIKLLKQLQREMRAEGKELDLEGKTTNGKIELEDEVQESEGEATSPADVETNTRTSASDPPVDTDDEDQQPWQPTVKSAQQVDSKQHSRDDSEEDESPESEDEDSDYAPRSQVENRLAKSEDDLSSNVKKVSLNEDNGAKIELGDDDTPLPSDLETKSTPKIGKAKLKRAKKAAAEAASATDGDKGGTGEFSCAVCGNEFASKTKLFNHIKEKNHAAPVTQVKGSGKSGKGKKR